MLWVLFVAAFHDVGALNACGNTFLASISRLCDVDVFVLWCMSGHFVWICWHNAERTQSQATERQKKQQKKTERQYFMHASCANGRHESREWQELIFEMETVRQRRRQEESGQENQIGIVWKMYKINMRIYCRFHTPRFHLFCYAQSHVMYSQNCCGILQMMTHTFETTKRPLECEKKRITHREMAIFCVFFKWKQDLYAKNMSVERGLCVHPMFVVVRCRLHG